jgi:hypothetical protein
MRIFSLVTKDAAKWVWTCANKELASVQFTEDGMWRVSWPGGNGVTRMLKDEFECAEDACLAAEKSWPRDGEWCESRAGGYFCNYGNSTFRVRRAQTGHWYAVRSDGKVLGRNGKVSWFATELEACRAVFAERHTPVDPDPFAVPNETWRWLKHVG